MGKYLTVLIISQVNNYTISNLLLETVFKKNILM